MIDNEEILRLVYESKEETREIAFGSDNFVFGKVTVNGETSGWKLIGRWESLDRLEKIAFEKYQDNWTVAWNGKFKPKGWCGNE
jgi:hypothetical protein